MSYGLRVWDVNGALRLDISDRLTKYLGSAVVAGSFIGLVECPNRTTVTEWVGYCYRAGNTAWGESSYDLFTSKVIPESTGVYTVETTPGNKTIQFWGF